MKTANFASLPASLLVGAPGSDDFYVHRDAFRDPAIFELEMRNIFEGTWIFVGLAAEAPGAHDYFTGRIGRHHVIVTRGGDGILRCFLNTCRHRGAALTHLQAGNAGRHVCPYHGWTYDSSGKCVAIKAEKQGCYPAGFSDLDHDLVPVARFAEYRGFLFASLNGSVPPLEEHLGEARKFLDLVVEQSPDGIEVIPGRVSFTYRGNWKLQMENGLDLYHLDWTHLSLIKVVSRRQSGESGNALPSKNFADYRREGIVRGSYTFKFGHAVVWGTNPVPSDRPLFETLDEVRSRVGNVKADWMLATRNLCLFPNVQITESAALLVRVIEPISVDRTEVRLYCIAPVGESSQMRERRIRQYEDFFNPTGLATADDNAVYEDCQIGFQGGALGSQQGYVRGTTAVIRGADEHARKLDLLPETSVSGKFDIQDETVFQAAYLEWARLMSER